MSYYTDGNILAYLAFFIWIPVALYGMWRWPPAKAMAVLFLGGILLLPESMFFKPPGLPKFTKVEVIQLWIFVGALIFHFDRLRSAPRNQWFRICVAVLVVGSVVTVFLNPDSFRVGSRFVPGHVPYDAVHLVITSLLSTALPFYLGAVMFRSSGDLRVLLTTMVLAAVLYSPLQFVEMILSPQLHRWVYGYHQHDFLQSVREGGYRPMAFMSHGLALALFTLLCAVAAAALYKAKIKVFRVSAAWPTSYLWVVLVLSRSLAAFLYSLIALPLALFASPRSQTWAATGLVVLLLAYPVARGTGLIPVEQLGEAAEEQFGADRAKSLTFRFEHEEEMLDRAMERPWFGWGGYCRACLYEPWSGDLISVRDGAWIIQLGERGIVGFVSIFILLLIPLIALLRRIKYVPRRSDRHLLAGLGLIVGFSAFDLIPNGDYNHLAFVMSGALLGCLTGIQRQAAAMRQKRRLAHLAKAREAKAAIAASLACTAVLCVSLVAAPAAATIPDAAGGGFAGTGVEGAYYANPDLKGTPSFTRRDVRIDFDWGEVRPVGGSTAKPYRSFPRDRFSVRWSGRVIPRFTEAYTFLGEADDGVRIRIRAPGQSSWTTLVDRWSDAGAFESRPFGMRANELYDIQVEYRDVDGRARCRLMWKSESAPAEVIDPVRQQGLNLTPHVWADYLWADLVKSARYRGDADKTDSLGWPKQSGVMLIASEMNQQDAEMSGTYLVRFEGQAKVHHDCCDAPVFQADGGAFQGTLPKGVGYDSSTNATTSAMTLEGSRTMLIFDDTQRGPGRRGDGVSRIQLMRPIALGSGKHHRPDEVVYRPFKQVVAGHFTVLRFIAAANNTGEEWSKRTLPSHAFFMGTTGQENWEHLVMLANETGADLYITIPIRATDDYLEKLALLMRYGSDGREPYRGPTADPIYPPLNPNLRVYVELDNEIWNWAFRTTQVAQRRAKAEHEKGSSTWKAIDYDGRAGDPGGVRAMRRWHAVRTVEASKAFRRVWGDEAMGPRVRVLLEYQYDNYQDTALSSLDFIDGYYNNRSSNNVRDPHPVSYYLWGAGGAAYYGLRNKTGEQSHTSFRDEGFEATPIESKTLRFRPRDTAWKFEGQAGLIRPDGEKQIDGLGNLPTPTTGKQAAFLSGDGSFSQQVRFQKPGTYAIAFNAAGSGEGWPGYLRFDILVDGRKVSPRGQSDSRPSPKTSVIGGWSRNLNSLEEEFGSATFRIDKPGLHTISFVGRAKGADYLLVDNVRIASADAIMTSGFDKGQAQGQEGDPDFAYQLRTQAKYARSFGLQVIAYESGWSVGGDFGQVPLQNWCKLHDRRATGINDEAIMHWDQSGSFLTVWGVYRYWPSHDIAGAGSYPIMRSFRSATQRLRYESTYGRALPATLRVDDTDWSRVNRGPGGWRRYLPGTDEIIDQWHAWMLTAPTTGTYTFRVQGRGDGRLVMEIDGEPVAELSSLETSAPLNAKLTKGPHAVRVVIVGGEPELDRIEVSGVEPL